MDQAVSSATNFAVLFGALRELPIQHLGLFTFLYTSSLTILAVVRALNLQPLAVRSAKVNSQERIQSFAGASGASLWIGLFFIVVAGTCAAAQIDSPAGVGLLASAALTALLLQDAFRFYFFATLTPWKAVRNDSVRLMATFVSFGVARSIHGSGSLDLRTIISIWGVGALAAALAGWYSSHVAPSLRGGLRWMRETQRLGMAYAGDVIIERGGSQLSLAAIGLFSGIATLGRIGASRTIMSPIMAVTSAVDLFALPEMARLQNQDSSGRMATKFAVILSGGLAASVLVFVLLLGSLPDRWGRVLAGSNWQVALEYVIPIGIWTATAGARQGPRYLLRTLEQTRTVLRASLLSSALVVAWAAGGATVGPSGAAWGLALGSLGSLWLWWAFALRGRTRAASGSDTIK